MVFFQKKKLVDYFGSVNCTFFIFEFFIFERDKIFIYDFKEVKKYFVVNEEEKEENFYQRSVTRKF